jgi:UDP-N-acetylglucosamine--N-acetylmuramyl-(pentapeptide) pyrophosphoryl-undecaprenol N-acetylglucosamine transferase
VREKIGRVTKSEATRYFDLNLDQPIVLFSGGSQGAHRINSAFVEMLDLLPAGQKFQFISLTGKEDVKWVKSCVESKPFRTIIFDFLNEIEYAYAASDLVVARAGATTISELLQCGKPSILIPYPHAAGHQRLNALLLERNGAASLLEDEVLTGRVLEGEVSRILNDRSRLLEMAEKARTLAKPDPAAAVVGEILRCLDT